MVHPKSRLTALKVQRMKAPGRYGDGGGLYLVVDDNRAKRWVLRTMVQGRRRDMGLGGASLVTLAEARKTASEYRYIARDGGDPFSERRRRRNIAVSFEEAAMQVHAENTGSWRNEKHRAQWINTLKTYAFPVIGSKPVNQMEPSDVLSVLTPIWLEKPETARRVRQRLRAVLDWAKAMGHCEGENPVDGVAKALPKQTVRPKHHAAIAYADVPAFVDELRVSKSDEATKLAFEFLILTAARTNEVIGARWDEIDLENKLWIVPAERMKAGREHRVPLSARCIEILMATRALNDRDSDIVFPGNKDGPLPNMALLMALRAWM